MLAILGTTRPGNRFRSMRHHWTLPLRSHRFSSLWGRSAGPFPTFEGFRKHSRRKGQEWE